MHTPHPPRPPYPPRPGIAPGEPDESLAGRLRGRPVGEVTQPVALLMARHWQATYDYAVVCLASSANIASMVTATAFHQVLGDLIRPGSATALRPRLLVAVRDTVREWSAEDRISGVLPELRKPAGGRGMRAAKSLTPESRALAERSFHALPGLARCLLWHTEVEAEHISVPAVLLGMDSETAAAALEQAREQFRAGCVRAHRELAPTDECRFHNRLLDVPIRRGGALLPEVQQHLLECRHCRFAAEQLSHFEGGLGVLLAEAVLGWGARRYLDSRPGRIPYSAHTRRGPTGGGRHRLLPAIPAPGRRLPPGEWNTKALLTGVGIVTTAVLATLLVTGLWSDDGGAQPVASTGASGARTTLSPGSGSQAPPAAASPRPAQQTRLRNVAAGLCLDIRGPVKSGAGTRLTPCSSAWTQQWSYESDGLLRSVADPGLCLDSHDTDGVVELTWCVDAGQAHADDVRYDLTVQGELLPRWNGGLAVTPAPADPDAEIVVKVRDGSDTQRWATEEESAETQSLSVVGTSEPTTTPASSQPPPTATSPAAPGRQPPGGPLAPAPPPAETYQERRAMNVGDEPRHPAPTPTLRLPIRLPDALPVIRL
ncbi:RICIN domain-containing protein [Streptomyces sp. TP-A0356]|uniref:RICIN domain-containing protein n=1 Tax=Streptomyces sp. TP-A0356 TaxID=1359208 RepID=UPI0007C857B5|nr:RICIN domain-containing protein [Streptomyces sp. TP-A0356]